MKEKQTCEYGRTDGMYSIDSRKGGFGYVDFSIFEGKLNLTKGINDAIFQRALKERHVSYYIHDFGSIKVDEL
jgi:hypothetical protein